MQNKKDNYKWTYDSTMNDVHHNIFLDDEGNDMVGACNLEVGLIIGDLRPELKGGVISWVEESIPSAADEHSDVEIINQQQIHNGLLEFEVLTDFREVVKDYMNNIAKGNDFKLELEYHVNLGVYTMRSVIYNGSFMTKDIVTTIDSEGNFKAVL